MQGLKNFKFLKYFTMNYINKSAIILPTITTLLLSNRLKTVPKYQGVPIPISILTHQSVEIFNNHFAGLEMSPVFIQDQKYYSYKENGLLLQIGFWPSSCTVTIPVYKKTSQAEEERMGFNGIKKIEVGYLEITVYLL
jgi:hypothetical protein